MNYRNNIKNVTIVVYKWKTTHQHTASKFEQIQRLIYLLNSCLIFNN